MGQKRSKSHQLSNQISKRRLRFNFILSLSGNEALRRKRRTIHEGNVEDGQRGASFGQMGLLRLSLLLQHERQQQEPELSRERRRRK